MFGFSNPSKTGSCPVPSSPGTNNRTINSIFFPLPPPDKLRPFLPKMVLSNKKLKQKLRLLTVESLATAESKDGGDDGQKAGVAIQVLESLKEELKVRRSLRHRPPRSPRKKKKPMMEEGEEEEVVEEDGEGKIEEEKKKKRKKSGADDEDNDVEKMRNERKEEKRRKKEEKKKRKEMEKLEKGKEEAKVENGEVEKESGYGGGEQKKVVEPLKVEVREESSDYAKKVYVGGIPYYSTEDDIRSFFDSCGTIIEVYCMTFPESGKFRGIAILTFKTDAAAKRALALDGADMGGLYLKIQPYKSTRPATKFEKSDFAPEVVEGYNRIYAGNLSWDITEDDLRKLLSDCNISSIRFGEDMETGEFKGYAHVDFADSVSLAIALKLDQKVVCGRPVRIRCAVPLTKEKGANAFKSNDNRANKFISSDNRANKFRSNEDGSSLDLVQEGKIVESNANSGKKKKRRTCYECGVPGHLASACPQKKTADAANSNGQG